VIWLVSSYLTGGQDSGTFTGRIHDRTKSQLGGETNVFRDVYDIPAGSDFRSVLTRRSAVVMSAS